MFSYVKSYAVLDYDIAKTILSGQIFRFVQEDTQTFLVFSKDKVCRVNQIENELTIYSDSVENLNYWENFFALNENVSNLEKVMCVNTFLTECFNFSKGVRILRQDPWEALIAFIISQRNSIPRIKGCIEKVCESTGYKILQGYYTFPTPEELRPISLRNCGLGYRETYIYRSAEDIRNRVIVLDNLHADVCSFERAIQELTRLSGVGYKVASCIALFSLGHRKAWPVDVWIERAMAEGNITKDMIDSFGEHAGLIQQLVYYYMINRS